MIYISSFSQSMSESFMDKRSQPLIPVKKSSVPIALSLMQRPESGQLSALRIASASSGLRYGMFFLRWRITGIYARICLAASVWTPRSDLNTAASVSRHPPLRGRRPSRSNRAMFCALRKGASRIWIYRENKSLQ